MGFNSAFKGLIDCSTLSICDCTRIRSFSVGSLSSFLLPVDCDIYFVFDIFVSGGQDSREMDCTRSHRFPQIHIRLWCMEFWYCLLGGDVIWRKAILELVQSRCNQEYRERLQVSAVYTVDLLILCFVFILKYRFLIQDSWLKSLTLCCTCVKRGASGGTVDWGTAQQAGRSRVCISQTSPSGCTMALGLMLSLTNEYQAFFPGG